MNDRPHISVRLGQLRHVVVAILATLVTASISMGASPYEQPRVIEGWKVYIHKDIDFDTNRIHEELQLFTAKVSENKLKMLRKTSIYIDPEDEKYAGLYKPKTDQIILYGPYRYGVLIHELAHAYHYKGLGLGHIGIIRAYMLAKDGRNYEAVESTASSSLKRAYALTNHREYFAELTQSYLAYNEYYPHTKADLKEFDAFGYQIARQIWGD